MLKDLEDYSSHSELTKQRDLLSARGRSSLAPSPCSYSLMQHCGTTTLWLHYKLSYIAFGRLLQCPTNQRTRNFESTKADISRSNHKLSTTSLLKSIHKATYNQTGPTSTLPMTTVYSDTIMSQPTMREPFTKLTHKKAYEAISSPQPTLSQKGKTLLISAAPKELASPSATSSQQQALPTSSSLHKVLGDWHRQRRL